MEKSLVVPQKINDGITISRNSTSVYIPPKNCKQGLEEISVYSCSQQYYSQQLICGSNANVNWQISKMWYILQWNILQPQKRMEILAYDTAWIDLEDIMLSEISQLQEDKDCMITLIQTSQKSQRQKTEWRQLGAGGGESRNYCLMAIDFQFFKMKRVLEMDSSNGCMIIYT